MREPVAENIVFRAIVWLLGFERDCLGEGLIVEVLLGESLLMDLAKGRSSILLFSEFETFH